MLACRDHLVSDARMVTSQFQEQGGKIGLKQVLELVVLGQGYTHLDLAHEVQFASFGGGCGSHRDFQSSKEDFVRLCKITRRA